MGRQADVSHHCVDCRGYGRDILAIDRHQKRRLGAWRGLWDGRRVDLHASTTKRNPQLRYRTLSPPNSDALSRAFDLHDGLIWRPIQAEHRRDRGHAPPADNRDFGLAAAVTASGNHGGDPALREIYRLASPLRYRQPLAELQLDRDEVGRKKSLLCFGERLQQAVARPSLKVLAHDTWSETCSARIGTVLF